MSSVFEEWTCAFPGKMGLSWKRAWDGVDTKEEAEAVASKNCNVVAVPVQLFEKMKEHERQAVKFGYAVNRLRVFLIDSPLKEADLPCRVDEMTERELKIFFCLADAIAKLVYVESVVKEAVE